MKNLRLVLLSMVVLLGVCVVVICVGRLLGFKADPGVERDMDTSSAPELTLGQSSDSGRTYAVGNIQSTADASSTMIATKGSHGKMKGPFISFESLQGESGPFVEIITKLNMRTNLSKSADFLGVNLRQNARVSIEGVRTKFIKIDLDDGRCFQIRGDVRELVVYMASHREDVPSSLTHKDAIDAEIARGKVQEFLSTLGFEEEMLQAENVLVDRGDPSDLADARWEFRLQKQYGEFRTSSFVKVVLSAYSGDVLSLSRMPLIIPHNMEVRIDEEDAIKEVSRFAKEIGLRIGAAAVADKWIRSSNPTVWAENREEMLGPDFSNPRPCYRVFAKDISDDRSGGLDVGRATFFTFSVDCYSGEIIGGGGRVSDQIRPELLVRLDL